MWFSGSEQLSVNGGSGGAPEQKCETRFQKLNNFHNEFPRCRLLLVCLPICASDGMHHAVTSAPIIFMPGRMALGDNPSKSNRVISPAAHREQKRGVEQKCFAYKSEDESF